MTNKGTGYAYSPVGDTTGTAPKGAAPKNEERSKEA